LYAYTKNYQGRDWLYIGATGSLLVSGIAFPLISDRKGIKNQITDVFHTAIKFFAIAIACSRIARFFSAVDGVNDLMQFTGTSLPFADKLLQFINFSAYSIFRPEAGTDDVTYRWISYLLYKPTTVNIFGMIILALVIIGFILTYRKRFSRLCMVWILYSFIVLCLIGWGTAENGLILYSLYFSWAFISLVFMTLEKLLQKVGKIKYVIYAAMAAVIITYNIPSIYEIVRFGIANYPA
jgi:hypothetical protein